MVEGRQPCPSTCFRLSVKSACRQLVEPIWFVASMNAPVPRNSWAIPAFAAGVGLSALENQYIVPDLDPGLKRVNWGIGGLTGLMMASRDPKMRALGMSGFPLKQLGLFGINSVDKLRQQQQSLVDANLGVANVNRQTAELNRSDAASRGRNALLFLIPALLAGGGLGYLGWSQYQKSKNKSKIPRYGTLSEKGKRTSGDKIRIDVPAHAIPPEFYSSLTNAEDSPRAYTRLMRLTDDESKEANEGKVQFDKEAGTDGHEGFSVPRFLADAAYQLTGIPGAIRTAQDIGQGAQRYAADDFSGASRYGAGALGNALLTLMTLRGVGFPLAGRALGQRFLQRQMGTLPGFSRGNFSGLAKMLHRWSFGPVKTPPSYTYDPNRFAWSGATTKIPFFKSLLTKKPTTGPSVPAHLFETGRYGANRLWNTAYRMKQFGGRNPFLSMTAIGLPTSMIGTELDERRQEQASEDAKAMRANWPANKGPMGIPVSSAFADLMKIMTGTDMRGSVREQLKGAPFDPWASSR